MNKLRHTFRRLLGARGLTLIEMAVVIAVLGLTSAGVTQVAKVWVRHDRMKTSGEQVATAHQRMDAFLVKNKRLPCPADITAALDSASFGVEAVDPGTGLCTTVPVAPLNAAAIPATGTGGVPVLVGTIPTRTLNIPDSVMFDGWKNRLLYAVTQPYTVAVLFPTTNQGAIKIQDAGLNTVASDVVYTILSHGANQVGAYMQSGKQQPPPPGAGPSPCQAMTPSGGTRAFPAKADGILSWQNS